MAEKLTDEEYERRLWTQLNTASASIRSGKTGDNGSEQAYSMAYRRLAIAGKVMKLKDKYR